MKKENGISFIFFYFLSVLFLLTVPSFTIAKEGRWVERIEDYFVDKVGKTWTYEGSVANKVMKIISYTNIATIKGIKRVDGVPAFIFSETNQGNKGPSLSYFSMGDMGIVYHGGEPTSDFEAQLIPYAVIPFPMQFNQKFIQVEQEGVPFGRDLDHDGIDELADVSASVEAESYETVSVPTGVYKNALKLRGTMVISLRLSGSKVSGPVKIIDRTTTWLVPGIGMVKGIETIDLPAIGERPATTIVTTELLTAFSKKAPLSQ